jgi:hypothetical protein
MCRRTEIVKWEVKQWILLGDARNFQDAFRSSPSMAQTRRKRRQNERAHLPRAPRFSYSPTFMGIADALSSTEAPMAQTRHTGMPER